MDKPNDKQAQIADMQKKIEKLKRIKELEDAIAKEKSLINKQEKINIEDKYEELQNSNLPIIDDAQEMENVSIEMKKTNQKKLNQLEIEFDIINVADYNVELEKINKKINDYNKELEIRNNILVETEKRNMNTKEIKIEIKKTQIALSKAMKKRNILAKIIKFTNKQQQKQQLKLTDIKEETFVNLAKANIDLEQNQVAMNDTLQKINLTKQIIEKKGTDDKKALIELYTNLKRYEERKGDLFKKQTELNIKIIGLKNSIKTIKKISMLEQSINETLLNLENLYKNKKTIFDATKGKISTKENDILTIELKILIKNMIMAKKVLNKEYVNIEDKLEELKNVNDILNQTLLRLLLKPKPLPIATPIQKPVANYIPVINLYEYGLFGVLEKAQKLSKLVDTTKCGKIKLAPESANLFNIIPDKKKTEDNYKAGVRCSCDLFNGTPVSQVAGFTSVELAAFNDKFQDAYVNYSMRRPVSDILQYNGHDMSYNDIIKIFDKAIIIGKEFLAQYDPTISTHNDSNLNIENYHDGAILLKMRVYESTKIITFGDLHGSYHTFFRHMERLMKMKIINRKTFEIKDNFILVFLGDIVDRGTFGLEILLFINILILRNNNLLNLKVIYNRGNHEELNVNIRDFVNNEIKKKFPNNNEFQNIQNKIFKLHTYLPSAIIIEMNDKRIWLSHGCFPVTKIGSTIVAETLNETFFTSSNNYEIAFFKKNDDNFFGIPSQIRWNDVNVKDNNTLENKGRNAGIILGPNILRDIMRLNNLTMIIRGHQDSLNNSWLYNEGINKVYKLDTLTNVDIPNIIKYNNVFVDDNHEQVIGSIAKINGDSATWDSRSNLLPVLTISTNTDLGRDLKKDSYIIISFENAKDF